MNDKQALTEANRKLVQGMYDASESGDIAGFMACLDENLVLLEPTYLPYGGRYDGAKSFPALLEKASPYLDVPTLRLESLIADGDVVVALVRVKTVNHDSEVQIAERIRIQNGKVVEMKIYFHELGTLVSEIKR